MDSFFDIDAELLALETDQDNLQNLFTADSENITSFQAKNLFDFSETDTAIGSLDNAYMDMLLELAVEQSSSNVEQPVKGKQTFGEDGEDIDEDQDGLGDDFGDDEDLDEIFVDGSIDTSDDNDFDDGLGDVFDDDDDGSEAGDDNDGDNDEGGEGVDNNGWEDVAEQMSAAIGLLADGVNAASLIALPGDKAALERLSQSLTAISLAIEAGTVPSADTLKVALGDAYAIALGEISSIAAAELGALIGGLTGPEGVAAGALISAVLVFGLDASGVSDPAYDTVGDALAQLTIDAVIAAASFSADIAALEQAFEDIVEDVVDDPEGFLGDLSGFPSWDFDGLLGREGDEEGYE